MTIAEHEHGLWEPHAAADPQDPLHLVAAVTTRPGMASAPPFANGKLIAATFDGGATWSTSELEHGASAPAAHPLAQAVALADPYVAFHPDGTVLVSGLAYKLAAAPLGAFAQGFSIFVARSHDGGRTFPDVAIVDDDVGIASYGPLGSRGVVLDGPDAPTMAVAPDGVVHLSWRIMRQATPAQPERSVMVASRSLDGGVAWSEPQTIDTHGQNAVAAQLIATRDGVLLAAVGGWPAGGVTEAQEGSQMLVRSEDGGRTWTAAVLARSFVSDIAWFPVVGEADGTVYFGYPEQDGGRERVVVLASRDGGRTFDARFDLPWSPASGHAIPAMGSDGASAYMTYFAPQQDGSAVNHLMAVRLEPTGPTGYVLIDGTLTQDARELGEYFAVAVSSAGAFPVWPNLEDGNRLLLARLS